jgi:transcriptional regulator with XRE-family HTH domain
MFKHASDDDYNRFIVKIDFPLIKEGQWQGYVDLTSDACWEWNAYCNDDGYGIFGIKLNQKYQTSFGAHRASYLYHTGNLPNNNCCHHCDNPSCVRPLHLFDATQKENIQDMINKHRDNYLIDTNHGNSILTEGIIFQIITERLNNNGLSNEDLAKKYNCSKSTIQYIFTPITFKKYANNHNLTVDELLNKLQFNKYQTKLVDQQMCFDIYSDRLNNLAYIDMENKYGISHGSIYNICNNTNNGYKHFFKLYANQLNITEDELVNKLNKSGYIHNNKFNKNEVFNILKLRYIDQLQFKDIAKIYTCSFDMIYKLCKNKIQYYESIVIEYATSLQLTVNQLINIKVNKYSDNDYFNILTLRLQNKKLNSIAYKYNCDDSTIINICYNKVKTYEFLYKQYANKLGLTIIQLKNKFKKLNNKKTKQDIFDYLNLRFIDGLTYNKISKKYNCDRKTVHNICMNKQKTYKLWYKEYANQYGLTSDELTQTRIIKENPNDLTEQQLFNIYNDWFIYKLNQPQLISKYNLKQTLISRILRNNIQKYESIYNNYRLQYQKINGVNL